MDGQRVAGSRRSCHRLVANHFKARAIWQCGQAIHIGHLPNLFLRQCV